MLVHTADVAALLAARRRRGSTTLVAVDGPSGSGKTTFARDLASLVPAALVSMDDIYPGWDGLEDAVPRLVEWVLRPVRRTGSGRYRRYDWTAGRYAEWHDVGPVQVLVVEGVGSAALPCAPYLDAVVWVEAPDPVRYARAMARDGEGYRPHWDRWARQERAHFAVHRTRSRADLRLDSRGGPGVFDATGPLAVQSQSTGADVAPSANRAYPGPRSK